MSQPLVPVGFSYPSALKRINQRMTLAEIADFLGYDSQVSVFNIIRGTIPAHPQGEAIWALYSNLFCEKPPISSEQARGEYPADIHFSE